MAVLNYGNYEGLAVFIYDMDGNSLRNTIVKTHNKAENQIIVSSMPCELRENDTCKLLIITSPAPCEYQGKIKKASGHLYIALFKGKEKESRSAERFKVTATATIDFLMCDGQPQPLHTPVTVQLINVCTGGVRFRAPYFSLSSGDVFRLNMNISNSSKTLVARVMNHMDVDRVHSDYGCKFVG